MASVNRQDGPRGPRWIVRYRRPDGGATQKSFTQAKLAQAFATTVEANKMSGTYVDPGRGRITYRAMAEIWLSVAEHTDTTATTVRSLFEHHVFPVIGDVPLAKLEAEPLALAHLRKELLTKLAPGTVRNLWGFIGAVFNLAVTDKRISVNPAKGLAPAKPIRPELRPLEGDAVEALVAALPVQYRGAAILAKGAGLRLGEALGFGPYRIDWANADRTLHVARQLIEPAGTAPYLRLPKGAKERWVPVGPSVTEPLAELLGGPRSHVEDRVDGATVELAFQASGGGILGRRAVDRAVKTAAHKLGLPASVHFHEFRHYYASSLIAAGCSEREVGLRLGHSSLEVTRIYGGLFSDAAQRTRDAVEAQYHRVGIRVGIPAAGQFQRESNAAPSSQAVTTTHRGQQKATIHTLTEGGKRAGQGA